MFKFTPGQLEIVVKIKELYLKYGIKSVTMDDACHEIGISKKTMYQHFSDKSQLVEAVIGYEQEEKILECQSVMANSVDAITEMVNIHRYIDKIFRYHSHAVFYDLKKYYPSVFREVSDQRYNHILTIQTNNITRGQAEGLYRPEVSPEIIAKMSLLRIEGCLDTCIFSLEEITSSKVFLEMMEYHVRGIATRKGIERLEELLKNE